MHSVVAIGGGSLAETRPFYEHALALTGAEIPKVTFLPTASRDSELVITQYTNMFRTIGVDVETVRLSENPSAAQVEDAILGADSIIGCGGIAKLPITEWALFGIPELLDQTKQRKTMQSLGGVSASADVWFQKCLTDHGIDGGPLEVIDGIGVVPNILFSPHHHDEYEAHHAAIMEIQPFDHHEDWPDMKVVAADDGAAFVVTPGDMYAVSAIEGRRVWTYTLQPGDRPHIVRHMNNRKLLPFTPPQERDHQTQPQPDSPIH